MVFSKETIEKMIDKGWNKEEIQQAIGMIYGEGKQEKHFSFKKKLNKLMYINSIILLSIASFFLSIVLVPFMIILQESELWFVIAIIGVSVGVLFDYLIHDLEHINYKHHFIAAIFIPAIGALNILLMVSLANKIDVALSLPKQEYPIIMALIFALGFTVPYTITEIRRWIKHKKSL